jgi:hypothetical protein
VMVWCHVRTGRTRAASLMCRLALVGAPFSCYP